jgi:hypothetical protein
LNWTKIVVAQVGDPDLIDMTACCAAGVTDPGYNNATALLDDALFR